MGIYWQELVRKWGIDCEVEMFDRTDVVSRLFITVIDS